MFLNSGHDLYEPGVEVFVRDLVQAASRSKVAHFPLDIYPRYFSSSHVASYGPYSLHLKEGDAFPYLCVSLYPESVELCMTLGKPTRKLQRMGAFILGDFIAFHRMALPPEDKQNFYLKEVIKEHPSVGDYLEIRPDGVYASLLRSAFPWGELIPELLPVKLFARIGMGDVYLDITFPLAPGTYVPLGVATLAFGLLDRHVLSVRK